MARMDAHASIAGLQKGPGIRLAALDRSRRLPVGSDIRLDAMEQRLRVAHDRAVLARRPAPRAVRTSCISRASRPQDRNSGLAATAAVGSSTRRIPAGGRGATCDTLSHRAPEGCNRKR